MSLVEYQEKEFAGKLIRQRISDGFLNATDMCKANNKLYADWFRIESTKEFLKELESDMGYPISQIIEIHKGNSKKYQQGTWIHPYVAINLSQWLSPKFSVFVSKLVFRYISGDISMIDEIKNNNKALQEQLQLAQAQKNEYQQILEQKEQALQESEKHLIKVYEVNKELLSFKKLKEKNQIVYIVSTYDLARQGLFKIGRTKNIKTRNSAHNNTHPTGDKIKILAQYNVNDAVLVESIIHKKLAGLRPSQDSEFFMGPFNLLADIVSLIIDCDERQSDAIDRLIDAVYNLGKIKYDAMDWLAGLDINIFKENILLISDSEDNPEKLAQFDITLATEEQKREFVKRCVQAYHETIAPPTNAIIWKSFQELMIKELRIAKSKFRAMDWKFLLKEEEKNNNLTITWRA